jgi:cytochrome c556
MEVVVMKSLIQAIVVAAALAAPVAVFAQASQPVTRAQVKAELAQLEKAGYHPGGEDPYYPADIEAAEAKVAAQNGATAVGGVASGSSESGHAVALPANPNSMYSHH